MRPRMVCGPYATARNLKPVPRSPANAFRRNLLSLSPFLKALLGKPLVVCVPCERNREYGVLRVVVP